VTDALAVVAPEGTLTYSELDAAAAAADPGPVLVAEPGLEFLVALRARLTRGQGTLLVDPRLNERERAQLSPPPERGVLLHTSGTTTGRPSPVVLTPENLHASAQAPGKVLGLQAGERWLAPLPFAHVAGLMVAVRCWLHGATVVLGPPALDRTEYVSLVPTQLQRLLDAGHTGTAQVVLGGAPAPRPLLERAAAVGARVRIAYGLTQTCGGVTLSEPGDLDTAGRPIPGISITTAPDGELLVEGPMVAGDGRLATGDLGRIEPDGRVTITGRKGDTIVSGGENVMPKEVEDVLLAHPAVVDAAVYGHPDPEWGEAVAARVVLAPGSTLDPGALRAFCRARLAGFKVPKHYEATERLPRSPGGKLLRREIRADSL
jgi:O-succinylbenzoic acid--CoA ligase